MLTETQIRQRDGKLTASRVGVLMGGDPQKIHDLWREMTGDPSYVPEDLSDVWPVQLGSHTESLHLDWIQKRLVEPVTRRGEVVTAKGNEWAAATLDGWLDKVPVECKHVGAYQKPDDIRARYQAQLHWQMMVTNTKKCVLSVIYGASEPVQEIVDFNEEYGAELAKRAEQFMHCVETLTPPVALPEVAAPVKIETYRKVDMSGSNSWAEHATIWITNKLTAKLFEIATKELKTLVEIDVGEAFGAGVIVTRNKAGSLSIKETK